MNIELHYPSVSHCAICIENELCSDQQRGNVRGMRFMGTGALSTLAVVRCGDSSLHMSWASGERKFDVGVSYFGDDLNKTFAEAKFIHRGKGGKWDGIFAFFQLFPETLADYDYFWFPDDDILATTEDVNNLIAMGIENNLHVFQPALDAASYYSHLITLTHCSFKMRYTNFVEIMVPFVSRDVFVQTLPMLEKTRSGFGLDFLWPKLAYDLADNSIYKSAIIDCITVRHTRPVGGSLHKFIEKVGERSSKDELVTALSDLQVGREANINGVAVPRIRILSGINTSGQKIRGLRLAAYVAFDMLRRGNGVLQAVKFRAALRHALKSLI